MHTNDTIGISRAAVKNQYRRRIQPLTIVLIVLGVAVIAAGTMGFRMAVKAKARDRMLEARFGQLKGYDGDPVIQSFRDQGQYAVAFLARKMKSPDSAVRVKAVEALRQMGQTFTGLPAGFAALSAALNGPDAEVRSVAEGALGDLGSQATSAVPALINCISRGTEINGVWALGRIGPNAVAALPILESKMRQPSGRERVYAAEAAWEISNDNFEARSVIQKALHDPDAQVRNDARNILAEITNKD